MTLFKNIIIFIITKRFFLTRAVKVLSFPTRLNGKTEHLDHCQHGGGSGKTVEFYNYGCGRGSGKTSPPFVPDFTGVVIFPFAFGDLNLCKKRSVKVKGGEL